jgi:hypothetical protein
VWAIYTRKKSIYASVDIEVFIELVLRILSEISSAKDI